MIHSAYKHTSFILKGYIYIPTASDVCVFLLTSYIKTF